MSKVEFPDAGDAPEIMEWLVTGPKRFEDLVTLREKVLIRKSIEWGRDIDLGRADHEGWARYRAPMTVLHDLAAIKDRDWLDTDATGRFVLTDEGTVA